MRINRLAIGTAAVALLGVTPAMAAAPVRPSVAQLSAMPMAGTNLSGARFGAPRSKKTSSLAAGAAVALAVLGTGAVAGGVAAGVTGANNSGHNDDTGAPVSP